ncbi:hypothetical protein HDV00_010848 [Rhizophlyctis rosea]|nr:hypothetical protein HDV00_010848 [Rhizophlyctis rosea]
MYLRQISSIVTNMTIATVPQAFKEARVQLTVDRFNRYLYAYWRDQYLPMLLQYNLNDEETIKMKRILSSSGTLVSYNAYFLALDLLAHGQWLMNQTMATYFSPSFVTNPHLLFYLRNVPTILKAFEDVSYQGYLEFLNHTTQNMNLMYGLLAVIPVATFIIGILLIRPVIMNTTQKEVEIVSMALLLPRKFVNERVETMELEIENIMEEIAEGEQSQANQGAAVGASSGTLPSVAVMRGYARRWMLKLSSIGLLLVAVTGAVMFIPALKQSSQSRDMIILIEQLSRRTYTVMATAMYSSEVIGNDTTAWLPGDPLLWMQDFADAYRDMDEIVLADGDVPSIQRFPSCYQFINQQGLCYLTYPANACDPSVRNYYPTIGLTYQLVTSGLIQISATWYDAVQQFIATPITNVDTSTAFAALIVELVEDIASATPTLNTWLVNDISQRNTSARSLNIFVFVLSIFSLVISYIFIFRWTVKKLREKLISVSDLFFSLPVPLVQSIPDLKRFVESGGAIIPANYKRN